MCGVNGAFAYRIDVPAPSRGEAIAVRDAMATRGPDGSGLWTSTDGRCLLGHRRLSIIDLDDRALQPMTSRDGRYHIVFNGEIYNYAALRADALAAGRSLATTSDTETLLDLYELNGPAMLDHLRGMFAFAIWDTVAHSLFVARDPFGIKPLYYSDHGGTFRFASQVQALRAGGAIGTARDPAGVVGFMLMGSVPEPFTWYRDISALPAGHCMTIDADGVAMRRYVDPAKILAEGENAGINASAAINQMHHALRDSIAAHLTADVPVGLFLSGGVDSAAILGVAMEHAAQPIQAITLGFDEFEGMAEDEVPVAARIADYYGASHSVRRIGRDEFVGDLTDILTNMDQPSIDGINTWFVSKAAREQGLKVAMSGLGADELLGGYPSFTDIPHWRARYGKIARLPYASAAAGMAMRALAPRFLAANPKATGLLRYAGSLGGAYMVRRALRLPEDFNDLLDRDFVAQGLQRLAIVDRMNATLDPMPGSTHGAISLLETSFYMRNQLLRDADWAGMRHSIEIRAPMVDIALFRKVAPAIPHLKPGQGKQLLADTPAKPLPDWHRHRAKTGFNIPYDSWMSAIPGLIRKGEIVSSKGLLSREWSCYLLGHHNVE